MNICYIHGQSYHDFCPQCATYSAAYNPDCESNPRILSLPQAGEI